MLKYEYAWEKFYIGLRCLAGTGTMKERLLKAYQSGIHTLRIDSLPDKKLSAELEQIQNGLSAKETATGGSKSRFRATIEKMTEREALEWSLRLVDLAVDVTRRSAIES